MTMSCIFNEICSRHYQCPKFHEIYEATTKFTKWPTSFMIPVVAEKLWRLVGAYATCVMIESHPSAALSDGA